jgi:hypothetical protein
MKLGLKTSVTGGTASFVIFQGGDGHSGAASKRYLLRSRSSAADFDCGLIALTSAPSTLAKIPINVWRL